MINKHKIKLVQEDIEQVRIVLSIGNIDMMEDICIRLNKKYKLKFDHIIAQEFQAKHYNLEKAHNILSWILGELKFLEAELKDEANTIRSKESSNLNIYNTNTTNINQSIIIKNTIDQIPDEILAKNLKYELKGILSELEYCKDNQEKKSKLMEVIKWLGDKAVDVAIACLPYLGQIKF